MAHTEAHYTCMEVPPPPPPPGCKPSNPKHVWETCQLVHEATVHPELQLELGYPAISYPDISIIRPWSSTGIVYLQLLSIFNYSLAQDKNKVVVKYLFYFIV